MSMQSFQRSVVWDIYFHFWEIWKCPALIFFKCMVFMRAFPLGLPHVLKCEHGKQDGYIFSTVSVTRCGDGVEETQHTFVRATELETWPVSLVSGE